MIAAAFTASLLWTPVAAATTTWRFDLPATAIASQSPPYPEVATLTLTQTGDGVQFLLDPNEASSGFVANAADAFIERIDYVYRGPSLSSASFRNDDGPIDAFSFKSNPNNMDAGYKAEMFHIVVDFPSKKNGGRFNPDQTRTWTVLGTTLSQFTDSFATANSKPTPIYGVLSVTAYSLLAQTPTPSNWVSQVHPLPEPAAATLTLVGLLLLAALGRRKCALPGDPSR